MCAGVVAFGVLNALSAAAMATTTTVDFDPPVYRPGETIESIPGVKLVRPAVVEARKETASPPHALQPPEPCESRECMNLAYQLDLTFEQDVNAVSMAVGPSLNSVCREGTCPVWARLVGTDDFGREVVDSGDVLVAENGDTSVVTPVEVTDPGSRIRSVTLSLDRGLAEPGHEAAVPRPYAIDDLSFTVDDTPPNTRIDEGPANGSVTNERTAMFRFSSEPDARFQCRFDGGSFAACTSPFVRNDLADREHSFAVRAIDLADNVDPTPALRSWTVDTGVDTQIIEGPPEGSLTSQRSATFAFSSEPGARFQCRIDSVAFVACSSPFVLSDLADGVHSFGVRAIDGAGNVDPVAAARNWTVDGTAPDTQIVEGPPDGSVTSQRSATFGFSSEAGARFECRLDGGSFAACGSPFVAGGLADGAHSFAVRAIDAAGNVDPVAAQRNWTVAVVRVVVPELDRDPDRDGVLDPGDNCPTTSNAGQADADADGIGDACDPSNGALAPVPLRTASVRVISGEVSIKYPPGGGPLGGAAGLSARAAQAGPRDGFVPLQGAMTIPLGSTLDTSRGRVELVTASDTRSRARPHRGQFFDGLFQIRQIRLQRARRRAQRARRLVTQLALRDGASASACSAAAAQGRARGPVRRLWGDGKGRFRTRTRASAGTVRGTVWLTEDRCDGTLTRVQKGRVEVRDFARRKTVVVKAGRSYLARARRPEPRGPEKGTPRPVGKAPAQAGARP